MSNRYRHMVLFAKGAFRSSTSISGSSTVGHYDASALLGPPGISVGDSGDEATMMDDVRSFLRGVVPKSRSSHFPELPAPPRAFWCLHNATHAFVAAELAQLQEDDTSRRAEGRLRTFSFDGSTAVGVRELSFSDAAFGSVCWGSSIALARFVATRSYRSSPSLTTPSTPGSKPLSPRSVVEGRYCVELGSGCGLGGLAAAASGAHHVVLSDCGHCPPSATAMERDEDERVNAAHITTEDKTSFPTQAGSQKPLPSMKEEEMLQKGGRLQPRALLWNLQRTAAVNNAAFERQIIPTMDMFDSDAFEVFGKKRLSVARIDWHEVRQEAMGSDDYEKYGHRGALPSGATDADVVLGSDLIYFPEDIAPLVETIVQVLRPRYRKSTFSRRRKHNFDEDSGTNKEDESKIDGDRASKKEAFLFFPGDDCDRGRKYVPIFIDALRQRGQVEVEQYLLTNYETTKILFVHFEFDEV